MATKYESIVETVEAIQFLFDNLKDIYFFIGFKDVTYSIKNRVLSGRITNDKNLQIPIAKEDYVVKKENGEILVMNKAEFSEKYKIKES